MSANRKLLIASPCRGGLPTHYFQLCARLVRGSLPGWDVNYMVESNNAILNLSRNIIANAAREHGDLDKILFFDTDHPVTEEHLARIVSHDDERYPIVSGMYCLKRPGSPFFLGIRAKGAQPDENSMLEAHFLPTGFLCCTMAALNKICDHHKDREFYVHDDGSLPDSPKQTAKTMIELFPYGVRGPRTAEARLRRIKNVVDPIIKRGGVASASKPMMIEAMHGVVTALTDEQPPGNLLGEDYAFSRLAQEAGVKQFLDLACTIPHIGPIAYPLTDPSVLATTCQQIPEAANDVNAW